MTTAVDLSLDAMNAAGFFEAIGGQARLKKRAELSDSWDPRPVTMSGSRRLQPAGLRD